MSEEALKPLLIGESNPYGNDPYYALYPSPSNSAGGRLCFYILGMRMGPYLREFNRVNLVTGKWSIVEARRRAEELESNYSGPLILLGSKVCDAFGVDFRPFSSKSGHLVLPHPSGRNLIWNDQKTIAKARKVVGKLLPNMREFIGVFG